jgi:hypothetical protein
MYRGSIVADLPRADATKAEVLRLSSGGGRA